MEANVVHVETNMVSATPAPLVNPPITQTDLDNTMLELENGDQEWNLGDTGAGDYTITLRLPTGLSCVHCVLQWWYTTGNNWKGHEPETFVNCADIKILPATNPQTGTNEPPVTAPPATTQPAPPETNPTAPPSTAPPSSGCYAVSPTATDAWCTANCAAGYCPASHCACS
ncbi:Hypothetical predicted protein [Paramuricea clavata]|uniref:Chitin-binding type-4 domain-containing protein n=1 Tax=Paramuricea clavata TaxID=317549 RepID=A0A7D9ICE4_PARCT|nr:Hypothetical predicted protein [Paramuricea clavata]